MFQAGYPAAVSIACIVVNCGKNSLSTISSIKVIVSTPQ
jgi:hypothetical protein